MWQCKKSLAVAIAVVAALLPPGVSRAQECNETAPNMLLVVDLSGSMDDYVSGWSGPTKWDVVKGAVKSIADKYALNSIRFGLELFADPDQSGNCTAGKIHVGIADNNAAAIQNKMNAESPWSNTPIKGALDTANAYQGIRDATRSNYVLLFTDGQETCDADQRAPVQAVKNLRANNIKTFVVGFGSGVDSALLAEMAAEGGTARPVPPHYYAADTSVELSDAFEEIASIISAIGGPCSVPGLLGVCAQSEWSCSNGNVVCLQENWPSVETCDGLDNNCDGPIDEDLIRLCPADGGTGVQVCSSGTWGECVVDYDGAIPDSGPMDAGSPDTGTPDAGAPDTGTPDTETPDTGYVDAGPTDSGQVDAGILDAGVADAGPADSGHTDTGQFDSGVLDTGIVDTGVADAGSEDVQIADTGMIDTGIADSGVPDAAFTDAAPADVPSADEGFGDREPGTDTTQVADAADGADVDNEDAGIADHGSRPKSDSGPGADAPGSEGADDAETPAASDQTAVGGGCSCAVMAFD